MPKEVRSGGLKGSATKRSMRSFSNIRVKWSSTECGGYSSVAERQTVALDVEGSTPSTHPKFLNQVQVLQIDYSVIFTGVVALLLDRSVSRLPLENLGSTPETLMSPS